MTKRIENGTVNQAKLDFDKMTWEYFHPDVLTGDLLATKIPTVDEIIFLGISNIIELRKDFRNEEEKLWKRLNHARYMLNGGLSQLIHETKEQNCDWCGTAIAAPPRSSEFNILSPKKLDELSKQIYSCRFGHEVANWCTQSPQPCKDSNRCIQYQSKANTDLAASDTATAQAPAQSLERCEHYGACYGKYPFKEKDCVFSHNTEQLVSDSKKYLKDVIGDCSERLNFTKRYISTLTSAKNNALSDDKPYFSLNVEECLRGVESGETVAVLSYDDEKHLQLSYGTCLDRMRIGCNVEAISIATEDNQNLQLPAGHLMMNLFGPVCLTKENFEYLVEHADFRKIWLRMVANPLNVHLVDQIGVFLSDLSEHAGK